MCKGQGVRATILLNLSTIDASLFSIITEND